MTSAEFDALFAKVSNWSRWPSSDTSPVGTMNFLTKERTQRAFGLVREGLSISLSTPIDTERGPDNPRPALHLMLQSSDPGTADYIAFAPHGIVNTHIDAVCHWSFHGELFDGAPAAEVTAYGAGRYSIDSYKNGIIGRGVLLDLPLYRGVSWLEPSDIVMPDELDAADAAATATIGEGDILLVRTGRDSRRRAIGREPVSAGLAGLHPSAATWLRERKVALMGSDGCHDAVPSRVQGVMFPLHALAITALGMPLIDNMELEALSSACKEQRRSDFLIMIAPPRVSGATGMVVNPIAVL